MIKIAVDAMGGDNGSSVVVEAAKKFVNDYKDVYIYLFGNIDEIGASVVNCPNIEIVATTDVMTMEDGVMAVRRKKDSSMVRAVNLVKEGNAQGVVSSGSTGAFLSSAVLLLDKIEGVDRPGLMANFPTYDGKGVEILDVGASNENTPEQLIQFAKMANLYCKAVKGIKEPKVALLNNGAEDKKGDELHKQTNILLRESNLNFIGNIEGRDILTSEANVIVSDGFSGNIALKTAEGTAKVVSTMFKDAFKASLLSKLGAVLAMKHLNAMKSKFDYKATGGALLIGLTSPVVKAHGSSDAYSFYNALKLMRHMIESDVCGKMKEGI